MFEHMLREDLVCRSIEKKHFEDEAGVTAFSWEDTKSSANDPFFGVPIAEISAPTMIVETEKGRVSVTF